jgi:hypothetical protein
MHSSHPAEELGQQFFFTFYRLALKPTPKVLLDASANRHWNSQDFGEVTKVLDLSRPQRRALLQEFRLESPENARFSNSSKEPTLRTDCSSRAQLELI